MSSRKVASKKAQPAAKPSAAASKKAQATSKKAPAKAASNKSSGKKRKQPSPAEIDAELRQLRAMEDDPAYLSDEAEDDMFEGMAEAESASLMAQQLKHGALPRAVPEWERELVGSLGGEVSDDEAEGAMAEAAASAPGQQVSAAELQKSLAPIAGKVGAKISRSQKKRLQVEQEMAERDGDRAGGVVYFGHLPFGLFEKQLRVFLLQFGTIRNLRLSRNPKTGKSRHYAFVEFTSREVARIVAENMDGYMMFGKTLVTRLLDPSEVHPMMFEGANRVYHPKKWRIAARDEHNRIFQVEGREMDPAEKAQLERRAEQGARKRRKVLSSKLKAQGIDYDLGEVPCSLDPEEIRRQREWAQQRAEAAAQPKAKRQKVVNEKVEALLGKKEQAGKKQSAKAVATPEKKPVPSKAEASPAAKPTPAKGSVKAVTPAKSREVTPTKASKAKATPAKAAAATPAKGSVKAVTPAKAAKAKASPKAKAKASPKAKAAAEDDDDLVEVIVLSDDEEEQPKASPKRSAAARQQKPTPAAFQEDKRQLKPPAPRKTARRVAAAADEQKDAPAAKKADAEAAPAVRATRSTRSAAAAAAPSSAKKSAGEAKASPAAKSSAAAKKSPISAAGAKSIGRITRSSGKM